MQLHGERMTLIQKSGGSSAFIPAHLQADEVLFNKNIDTHQVNAQRGGHTFQPLVSIIIPAHNEEKRIERCIKSIFNLEYPSEKKEIIIVDDGSQDRTVDIACKYGITVLRQQHLGCSAARNLGAETARGEIIAFLDADDVCKEEWLAEAVQHLDNERIAAVGCSHGLLNSEKHEIMRISHKEKLFRHSRSPEKTEHIGASGAVIKKSVFFDVGGFNPEFLAAEDADLSRKIVDKGYEVVLIKKPLIRVTYPTRLHKCFLAQVRNSAFLTFSLTKNVKRAFGNRYSNLGDYVQSVLPTVCILSLSGGSCLLSLVLFVLSLSIVNIRFLRYLSEHRQELSKLWFLSCLFYLTARSVAWNVGLLCGLLLALTKKLRRGLKK